MTAAHTPKRASDVIAEFADFGVATVYEAAGRVGLIDVPLIRLTSGARAAGPARTAACGQDDNRAVHAAVADARRGDVLVLAMPEPRPIALVGELLVTQAKERGVAAILVDAAVRDADEVAVLGVPIWARYVCAAGASKVERGQINGTVSIGGAQIRPDDVVVLDGDGAVVVARERVDEVVSASRARVEREADLRARFQLGEVSYDIYGMRAEDASV